MKKIKKVVALLTLAVLLASVPRVNTIKVSAADPVTYAVWYSKTPNQWYYQANTSEFDKEKDKREAFYLRELLKDGDIVVVYNEKDDVKAPDLNLGTARLSNLTFAVGCRLACVYAGGVDNLVACQNSTCSVNCDVVKADVYPGASCTVRGNVSEMNLAGITDNNSVTQNVSCTGTVGHLYAPSDTEPRVYYNLYDFKADKLRIKDGSLKTDDWNYSKTPSTTTDVTVAEQQPAAEAAPADAAAAPAETADYDNVPKTGDNSFALWLALISALCFAGAYVFKKRAVR